MIRRKMKRFGQLLVNTVIPFRTRKIKYYNQYSIKYFFKKYGDDWLGLTGCGPFACAIVDASLNGEDRDPVRVARWAVENGFYEYKHGSLHSLIPEYCKYRGLKCEDLGSNVDKLINCLEDKEALAIILCKKGTFSAGRHFIVVGMENGAIKIYNSSNVLDCFKTFDKATIQNSLADENIYIGPIWCISKNNERL